ncbi:hypothetical protein [Paenibacillus odorifer]|uniref:hypothetical protein n=1 Tax=Paenibacillus odorifer TaxID=189426 RepID=UPI00096C41A9|nr:hypothetical protein [Paenibacillus odorifer]OMD67631.1 hypothetical protein BSK50_30135 [Paenibacillus odorifer]
MTNIKNNNFITPNSNLINSVFTPISNLAMDIVETNRIHTDIVHKMFNDKSRFISNSILDYITPLPKSAFDSIQEQVKIFNSDIANSLLSAMESSSFNKDVFSFINTDTINLMSEINETISNIGLSAMSTLSYEQYKPVNDLIEVLYDNDLITTYTDNQDTQASFSDIQDVLPINDNKPIPFTTVISIVLSLMSLLISFYANVIKTNPLPHKMDTLIKVEGKQLELQKLQYDEEVRHNAVSEETDKNIQFLLEQISNMMLNQSENQAE